VTNLASYFVHVVKHLNEVVCFCSVITAVYDQISVGSC